MEGVLEGEEVSVAERLGWAEAVGGALPAGLGEARGVSEAIGVTALLLVLNPEPLVLGVLEVLVVMLAVPAKLGEER